MLLIVVTSGAILAVTVIAGQYAAEHLSRTLIDRAAQQTEKELDAFFATVHKQVIIGREWAHSGLLDADDHLALNKLFVPVLQRNPQMSSMMVSESTGTGYLLLRNALKHNEWMNRVVRIKPTGNEAYFRYWDQQTGAVRDKTVPTKYDSRKRGWYLGSLKTQAGQPGRDVFWTKPVIFKSTKDPGITAGAHVKVSEGLTLVVAFDLLLLDIARMTTKRIKPSANGTAFVLVEEKKAGELRVVGLPRDDRYRDDKAIKAALIVARQTQADAKARLPRAESFPVGPVAAAVKAWRAGGMKNRAVFQFQNRGEDWWAEMRSYDVGQNRFWICVAVPEKDFLGEVKRQQLIVIGISLIALIGAIIMAFVLARRYARPLEQLVSTSQRIRNLDLDVDATVQSKLREINDLAHSQHELILAMQSFVRYVPLEVVRELVKQGEVAEIGGTTRALTLMFTDIRGFTSISEQMEPQDLAEHMAEYFELMLAELNARGATVDKFVGDAIVAFWGAPKPDPDHTRHAMQSALACVQALEKKNKEWEARGLPPMPTRFGLATGEVVVGNIGAASRLSYTVLGDRVNLAARLEGANKLYGTSVLVTSWVMAAAGEGFEWRRMGRVAVKGKIEAVDIFTLLGATGEVPEETLRFARDYEAALDLFQSGDFAAAREAARILDKQRPDDISVERLIESCETSLEEPPDSSWDGTVRLTTKG